MNDNIKYLLNVKVGFLRFRKNLQGINIALWKHKFELFGKCGDDRASEILQLFLTSRMTRIKDCELDNSIEDIILFCVIKDDLDKAKLLMEHYRKLGVDRFVFLDNCSSDGTKEYLCEQEDAYVYECVEEYSSAKRVAWLNRMLALHGDNHWCIIVDSDEFITYKGRENHTLKDLIAAAWRNNYRRIEGFLLDMYPRNEMFSGSNENSLVESNYFDKDTYKIKSWKYGAAIVGGPRYRVFHRKVYLSKYPVFYMGEDDFVASSHTMIPVYPVKETPIWIAICHYKFVDEKDIRKIRAAVKKENYAAGSADYKAYLSKIEKNDSIVMYDEKTSVKLNGSKDLEVITFLSTPFE